MEGGRRRQRNTLGGEEGGREQETVEGWKTAARWLCPGELRWYVRNLLGLGLGLDFSPAGGGLPVELAKSYLMGWSVKS